MIKHCMHLIAFILVANLVSACSFHEETAEESNEQDLIPRDDFEPLFTIGDEHPTMENLVKKGHILLNGLDVKKEVGSVYFALNELDIFQDVETDQYFLIFRVDTKNLETDHYSVFDVHEVYDMLPTETTISTNNSNKINQIEIDPNPFELYFLYPSAVLAFSEIMFPVPNNEPENIEFITLHLPETYTIEEQKVTFPDFSMDDLSNHISESFVESLLESIETEEEREASIPGDIYREGVKLLEYYPEEKPAFRVEDLTQVSEGFSIRIQTNRRLVLETR
ncbi:hypothetical protein [Halalkalibacterium halodurans]|uniref:hypothetical protein n=1 Tax=Halalkalibacterium halodurans TaxID=86665 RepID=UPI0010FF003F|nr:hypothetical protein [Halalkalibacterium halodurans]